MANNLKGELNRLSPMRKSALSICVFMLGWFLLTFPLIGIDYGNIIGTVLFAALICYIIKMPEVNSGIKKFWHIKCGRIILSAAAAAAACGFVFVGIVTSKMTMAAFEKPVSDGTVIVLGCKVNGTRPSLSLERRLDKAAEYLTEHKDAMCIVTGNKGSDEEISEAQCMEDYLILAGIDKDRIIKEDKAKNTRQNMAYSKEIIESRGLDPRVVIITNGFHEYRACLIAKGLGIEAYPCAARSVYTVLPAQYIRELMSILNQLLFA